MTAVAMTVGGEQVAVTSSFGVIDPATGEVFDRAPACEPDVLDAAFAAARTAAGAWAADEEGRRAALRAAADTVGGARDELAVLLSTEQGKSVKAAAYEVDQHALWLRTAADLSLAPQTLQDDDRAAAELVRRPLGPPANLRNHVRQRPPDRRPAPSVRRLAAQRPWRRERPVGP
jgi:acyl-CoA reductase-like NAD-dependent aldehyde dehydrogenase